MNSISYKIENCCKNTIIDILKDPKLPNAIWHKTENTIYVNSNKINRGLSQKETFNHKEKSGIIDLINSISEAEEDGFSGGTKPQIIHLKL